MKIIAVKLLFVLVLSLTSSASSVILSDSDLTRKCQSDVSVKVILDSSAEQVTLKLSLSTGAIVNGQISVKSERMDVNGTNVTEIPCLYHGECVETKEAVFAHVLHGVLHSTFRLGSRWFRVTHPSSSTSPAVASSFDEVDADGSEGLQVLESPQSLTLKKSTETAEEEGEGRLRRRRRSLKLQSFRGSVFKKMLELVVVADTSFISQWNTSSTSRVMEIVNYVNGIFAPFGLRVILKQLVLWDEEKILRNDSSWYTKRNFCVYHATQISVRHDLAVLLSGVNWDSGVTIGSRSFGSVCNTVTGCSIISDKQPASASFTSRILAESIGYSLGLNELPDLSGCSCRSAEDCVMNKAVNRLTHIDELKWSNCSLVTWQDQADTIWRSCLQDSPAFHFTEGGATCGNGIVESGEQCDCGPEELCTSSCCDASTCQLKAGAACASGSCCNWTSCQLLSLGHVCRPADGACDVEETCNTKTDQCKRIFSSAAAAASDDRCYQYNLRGDKYGHCHAKLTDIISINSTHHRKIFSYTACTDSNARCGLTYCYQATQPTVGIPLKFNDGVTCYGHPGIDQSVAGLRSPSLVPDGAACGINKMCLNSTCVSVSSLSCPDCPSCHGNGVLTAAGVCFCNDGFEPPNCESLGCGGSVTSRKCDNLSELVLQIRVTSETFRPEFSSPSHWRTQRIWNRFTSFLRLSLVNSGHRILSKCSPNFTLVGITSGSVIVKSHVTLACSQSVTDLSLTEVAAAVKAGASVTEKQNVADHFVIDTVTAEAHDFCSEASICPSGSVCSVQGLTFSCNPHANSSLPIIIAAVSAVSAFVVAVAVLALAIRILRRRGREKQKPPTPPDEKQHGAISEDAYEELEKLDSGVYGTGCSYDDLVQNQEGKPGREYMHGIGQQDC